MSQNKDNSSQPRAPLALIGAPSSAGAHGPGQERGPAALRAAGLVERLRENGLDVADLGDLPSTPFRDDPARPRERNLRQVAAVARELADRVDGARAQSRTPLVLGGDCSLSLGVISGLLRRRERLGLVYFDGDVDLNTPETTVSGIFDGMVLAHVLGRGAAELAGLGPRRPLLSEEDVALFGYDPGSGWVDPPELEALERSKMAKYDSARVRENAAAAARDAIARLESRADALLVHFDVDVMDFPAADVHHPRGLDLDSAMTALRLFVSAASCAGVVVTEFNPDRDPDGSLAARLVEGLAAALGRRSERAA